MPSQELLQALLREQRSTNRLLRAWLWMAVGFVGGMFLMRVMWYAWGHG
jgi:hypothetical protein